MIDFTKFGFTIKEIDGKKADDNDGTEYENELLDIQHWKKPDIYSISIRRERLLKLKTDKELLELSNKYGKPLSQCPYFEFYEINEKASKSEKQLAEMLLGSNFYNYPLYVGEIKDETFFEILINAICANCDKLVQCGS